MALSTYTELKAAVQTELSDSAELTDTIVADFITRAESKINRKTRMREQEQLSYTEYTSANTTRRLALPNGFLELLDVKFKKTSEADTNYADLTYVGPLRFHEYYDRIYLGWYTLRDEIELNKAVTESYTLMMHYLKRWDIATDSTNYLLTNYPDVYLYGACAEAELLMRNDPRIAVWKALFEEGIRDLNRLDQRGRDDAELDVSEAGRMVSYNSGYNILTS